MSGGQLIVTLVVIAVASLVKAITGTGFPLIVTPILTLFLPLEDVVAIVAVPNAVSNVVLAGRERGHWPDTRDLPTILGFGLVGAVAGTFVLVSVPERPLLLALAALVVAFVANSLRRPDFEIGPDRSRRWSPAVGFAAGVSQGAVGISGPIVVPWIQSYRLPRNAQVLSVTSIFLVTGMAQVATLAANGEYGGERLGLALVAIVPTLAAIPLGTRLRERLGRSAFDRAVLGIIGLSGLSLLLRALAG